MVSRNILNVKIISLDQLIYRSLMFEITKRNTKGAQLLYTTTKNIFKTTNINAVNLCFKID